EAEAHEVGREAAAGRLEARDDVAPLEPLERGAGGEEGRRGPNAPRGSGATRRGPRGTPGRGPAARGPPRRRRGPGPPDQPGPGTRGRRAPPARLAPARSS